MILRTARFLCVPYAGICVNATTAHSSWLTSLTLLQQPQAVVTRLLLQLLFSTLFTSLTWREKLGKAGHRGRSLHRSPGPLCTVFCDEWEAQRSLRSWAPTTERLVIIWWPAQKRCRGRRHGKNEAEGGLWAQRDAIRAVATLVRWLKCERRVLPHGWLVEAFFRRYPGASSVCTGGMFRLYGRGTDSCGRIASRRCEPRPQHGEAVDVQELVRETVMCCRESRNEYFKTVTYYWFVAKIRWFEETLGPGKVLVDGGPI